MATVRTTATTSWQSVTISTDEVWLASGPFAVILGDDAEPSTEDDAFPLERGVSIGFATGKTIYYRAAGDSSTYIHRIGVST